VVVQHAIYNTIYPIFNPTFIDTSFACRIGYGTHKAIDCTQRMMNLAGSNLYYLKLDIKKYFYSIDRDILFSLFEKKIKDYKFNNLLLKFTKIDTNIGIPIGNLVCQLYALIYLNPIDYFIKRFLKIKNYVRYVDDMVLIGLDRFVCFDLKETIIEFLKKYLKLELSKFTIQKIGKCLNFVGYRTWISARFIRKYSLFKFFRFIKIGKINSIISLLGHAKWSNSLYYLLFYLKNNNVNILNQLPNSYRKIALIF